MADFPIWEPPIFASEQEHLFAMLDRLRATFRYKADGLNLEQLKARLPSSELSMGGLLQHLLTVEDEKFSYFIARERPEVLLEFLEQDKNPFIVQDDEDPRALYERYDKAVAKSRLIQQQIIDDGTLDTASGLGFEGQQPSVRRIICDLIEEYGRHTGHSDLIREAIDGRVGEDPPQDFLPMWFKG